MGFQLPEAMQDGRHQYRVRVYFEDTDAGGVAYHASYLRFAERARTEALREMGVPHAALIEQFGMIFVVRRATLDYLRPARLDDFLLVTTFPRIVGGASVTLQQIFQREGVRIAVIDLVLVCLDRISQRPARLPDRWRQALSAMADAAARSGGKEKED